MNMRRENGLGRERFKIALKQFSAGRILVGLGRIPSRRREQAHRRAIDIVLPWREHLDMAPSAHRVPDTVAGFQHNRPEASLQSMRGCGQTNRAGSDDCHGLCFTHAILPSN